MIVPTYDDGDFLDAKGVWRFLLDMICRAEHVGNLLCVFGFAHAVND